MQAGKVIRWDNFRDRQYGGDVKPRWFVCLGNTGLSSEYPDKRYYFHSTTTTPRIGIKHILFKPSKYKFFTEPSYLYFNEGNYLFSTQDLNTKSVLIKGCIDHEDLKTVYLGILQEPKRRYSGIELLDIHANLNSLGLCGLKKP